MAYASFQFPSILNSIWMMRILGMTELNSLSILLIMKVFYRLYSFHFQVTCRWNTSPAVILSIHSSQNHSRPPRSPPSPPLPHPRPHSSTAVHSSPKTPTIISYNFSPAGQSPRKPPTQYLRRRMYKIHSRYVVHLFFHLFISNLIFQYLFRIWVWILMYTKPLRVASIVSS